MIFHVSDSGVFKSGLFVDLRSPSPNAPSKPSIAGETNDVSYSGEGVAREAQKAFINTPAFLVTISSSGKAALDSMKSLSTAMNNFNKAADNESITTNLLDNSVNSKSIADVANDFQTTEQTNVQNIADNSSERSAEEEQQTESSVNTADLSRYSEVQLRKMVNEGSITRKDMNDELEKRVDSEEEVRV